MRLLVEYKFFEPAFYSTDLPDWGTAALICRRLGPQAQVLVDTGHHPQGTNVEQIVALLLAEGLLGGFHFNNRKYADDDLIVGSIDPFELFRIMREIARGATPADQIAFMIDQSHNIEGKIDAMIQSVMNIQTAYAKALLVDEERLAAAQRAGDVLGAHRVLLDAFETDVRPLLARLRERDRRRGRIRSRRSAAAATPSGSRASAAPRRSRARTSALTQEADDPAQRFRPPRPAGQARRVRRGAPSTSGPRCSPLCATPASATTRSSAHGNEMFGYFEADDLEAAAAYMASQEVNARWQDAMAELLEERVPDAGPPPLEEVFRLDESSSVPVRRSRG